nr:YjcZ family sporulation protein [Bacillus sp. CECT 9360]
MYNVSPYSGQDCCYPVAGYGYCDNDGGNHFALIVVLFILLIIVGAFCKF